MEYNVIFVLQTIFPSLMVKSRLTQVKKVKVYTCHAYITARWHMAFLLYGHLIAFVQLCYMDRCHLLPSYKTAQMPLCKNQFNSCMANELLSTQRQLTYTLICFEVCSRGNLSSPLKNINISTKIAWGSYPPSHLSI